MIGAGRSSDSDGKDDDSGRPLHYEQDVSETQKRARQNPSPVRPSSGRKRKATTAGKQDKAEVSSASRTHRSSTDINHLPGIDVETAAIDQRVPTSIGFLPMISSDPVPPVVAAAREYDNDGSLMLPASGMARDSSRDRPQGGLQDNISDPAWTSANVPDAANLMHMPFAGQSWNVGTLRDSDVRYGGATHPTLAQSAFPVPQLFNFSHFGNQCNTSNIQGGVAGQLGGNLTISQSNATNLVNASLRGNIPRLDSLMVPPIPAGLPSHTSSSSRHQFPPTGNIPSSNQSLAYPMMNHSTITSLPSDDIEAVVKTSSSTNDHRSRIVQHSTTVPSVSGSLSGAATAQHGLRRQQQQQQQQQPQHNEPTGRTAILSMESDPYCLSKFQTLSRKQIQLFEAMPADIAVGARGRNNPITLGQVGIRCIHCMNRDPRTRKRGACYFPTQFNRVYQTAVNMASSHLCIHCDDIPKEIRDTLLHYKSIKQNPGGGKDYWACGIQSKGIIETENGSGLRFR